MNVMFVGSVKVVAYLFKYVFKGDGNAGGNGNAGDDRDPRPSRGTRSVSIRI